MAFTRKGPGCLYEDRVRQFANENELPHMDLMNLIRDETQWVKLAYLADMFSQLNA